MQSLYFKSISIWCPVNENGLGWGTNIAYTQKNLNTNLFVREVIKLNTVILVSITHWVKRWKLYLFGKHLSEWKPVTENDEPSAQLDSKAAIFRVLQFRRVLLHG